MHPSRPRLSSTKRRCVLSTCAVVIVVVIGGALREQSARRQRQSWARSIQSLGVQTYPLSPLSEPSPTLGQVVVSLVTNGDLGVVIADDEDARRLIAHEGDCPRGTCIVISPRVSDGQKAELSKRYPTARMTTFTELYGSNSPSGGGPDRVAEERRAPGAY